MIDVSREIYSNNQKNFSFFHLNPPKIFLSILAIKQHLRPKYPSLISPPTLHFTHLSQTNPTPIIGGDINPRRRRLHLSPASDLRSTTFNKI